ncbi:MAG: hypothetical protein IPJ00_13095 [Saprospirales bacterium]|jgi:hypothetical protein|nr:hypothetical protein [Saprospirales bacterium]MBK7337037.1 hypothetical protein [Saprospirales bacterium]
MKKINSESELRETILQLERQQEQEGKMLREQFHLAYDSIKPVNLIKSTLSEAIESRDLKDNLFNAAVGLTTGFLSKVLFEGKNSSPLKKLLGTALMFGITRLITQNPGALKTFGKKLLNITRKK